MTFTRAHLLAELRKGPVDSRYWRSVATTRKALQVRIHQLREAGYVIDSKPTDNGILRGSNGLPQVSYILRAEPCCAHCGK